MMFDMLQESESEDDFVEGEDEEEEEPEPEPEASKEAEPVVKKPLPALVGPKDTEKQLSKKELKKKELAELEAVLAELGISGKDDRSSGQNEANGNSYSCEKHYNQFRFHDILPHLRLFWVSIFPFCIWIMHLVHDCHVQELVCLFTISCLLNALMRSKQTNQITAPTPVNTTILELR